MGGGGCELGGDLRLNQTLKCEVLTLAIHGVTKNCFIAVQPGCTNGKLPAEHFPGHSKCNAK